MKTVFSPASMVAHVWAQRTQVHGKSSHGNFSFHGPKLYSYAALIARFVEAPDGSSVVLVTSRTWSPTTSGHQGFAKDAARHFPTFTVPDIGDDYSSRSIDHTKNLASLVKECQDGLATMKRKRDVSGHEPVYIRINAKIAHDYASMFALPAPDLDIEAEIQAILNYRAERDARLNTPEAAAKRERDRERRETLRAEREQRQHEVALEEASEAIAAWRDGSGRYLPYNATRDASGGAMLRIRGDNLETSQDATVPLSHAIRVFHKVAECRANGTEWHRNGAEIRVGHFNVSRIEPDGTLHAGCHKILWPEIESAAKIAGVLT